MARIVKNGVSYTVDAAALTSGSSTVENSSGHLEVKTSGVAADLTTGSSTLTQSSGVMEVSAAYVRGDASTGAITSGVFKIYSGTTDPSSSLGQNGDIYLKRVSS